MTLTDEQFNGYTRALLEEFPNAQTMHDLVDDARWQRAEVKSFKEIAAIEFRRAEQWRHSFEESMSGRSILEAQRDIANAELAKVKAENERYKVALHWFLADERFQVAVGGNPGMVARMIAAAQAIYKGTFTEDDPGAALATKEG